MMPFNDNIVIHDQSCDYALKNGGASDGTKGISGSIKDSAKMQKFGALSLERPLSY